MPTNSNLKAASSAVSLLFYERFRGLYIKSDRKYDYQFPNLLSDKNSSQANRMARQAIASMSQVSSLPVTRELMKKLSYVMGHCVEQGSKLHKEAPHYIAGISGFRFNETTSLNQILEVNFEINWKSDKLVSIKIPSIRPRQDIIAPTRTLQVELKITPLVISLNSSRGTRLIKNLPFLSKSVEISNTIIPYTKEKLPACEIELELNPQPNSISMLIASLQFSTMKKGCLDSVKDKKWLPVDILSASFTH